MLTEAAFGYRQRPMRDGLSSFQLLYVVKPRLPSSGESCGTKRNSVKGPEVEFLAVLRPRASRAEYQTKDLKPRRCEAGCQTVPLVSAAYGKVFKRIKCVLLRSEFYGTCRVAGVKRP